MARKVVAVVLLGLLACAALASAQDTANQNKDATKDAEKHLDNEHEKEDYNKYMQDKHDKPHKHHKPEHKDYSDKPAYKPEHTEYEPKHHKPEHKEYELKEHYAKAYKHYKPEEEEEYEPKPRHYKAPKHYKSSHDEPKYEPEEPHMDLPHKLVKVPHMAKELEFSLDVTNFMPQGSAYTVGSNWLSKFDLSYKGKTVGEATLTGVIVYAEKGVVAVNAEIIIKSAGEHSEEAVVIAAGLVVVKLDTENKFVGFENGGPEFVITGGTGAMAGVEGTVAFAVELVEGMPKTTATFDITVPKQKPEKMNKEKEE